MVTTCPRCGKSWTGRRPEHCVATGCHETFVGSQAGDKHRVGNWHDPANPRRCLSPEEMRAAGFGQDPAGLWFVVADRERARAAFVRVKMRAERDPPGT